MSRRPFTPTARCRSRKSGDRCDRPELHDGPHRAENTDSAGHPVIHQWQDPR